MDGEGLGREVKVPQPADHIMAAAPGPWERVLMFKGGYIPVRFLLINNIIIIIRLVD